MLIAGSRRVYRVHDIIIDTCNHPPDQRSLLNAEHARVISAAAERRTCRINSGGQRNCAAINNYIKSNEIIQARSSASRLVQLFVSSSRPLCRQITMLGVEAACGRREKSRAGNVIADLKACKCHCRESSANGVGAARELHYDCSSNSSVHHYRKQLGFHQ